MTKLRILGQRAAVERWVAKLLGIVVLTVPMTSSAQSGGEIAPARGDDEAWQYVGILRAHGVSMEATAVAAAARDHESSQVRWAALELLSRVDAEESRELFAEALRDDQNRLVRETAALALARLGDPRGQRALKDFLDDASPPRDLLIAAELAERGDWGGYSIVADAVVSTSPVRREDAARFLPYFMGARSEEVSPEPAKALERLLADPEESVRKVAVEQLSLATERGFSRSRAQELANALAEQDHSAQVRQSASSQMLILEHLPSTPNPCEGAT